MDHRTPPSSDGDLPAPLSGGAGSGRAGSSSGAGPDAADPVAGGAPGAPSTLLAFGRPAEATRDLVAATAELWTLGTDQLVAALEAQYVALAQHQGTWLALIRDLDTRGHHTHTGATSTAAWLSHHCSPTGPPPPPTSPPPAPWTPTATCHPNPDNQPQPRHRTPR